MVTSPFFERVELIYHTCGPLWFFYRIDNQRIVSSALGEVKNNGVIYGIFEYIAPNYHITLMEWNHDQDRVHVLFRAHPKSEISKLFTAHEHLPRVCNMGLI